MKLAEMTWSEAGEAFAESGVAIIPVGSTEQHGPHNPLGTDSLIAAAVAGEVGERTSTVVLPVVPVGVSAHHRQFPGSLWVPPRVLRAYVREISLSLSSHGVRKILFVNGHGGNDAALAEVAGELRREHGVFAAVASAFPPALDGHAGEGETSANLYFHGHLVKMERAVDQEQNDRLGPFEIEGTKTIGPAKFPRDVIDLTPTGILGNAGFTVRVTMASMEGGRRLMEPHIEALCAFVENLKRADLGDLLCKPHL